jgi:hypothetical protein
MFAGFLFSYFHKKALKKQLINEIGEIFFFNYQKSVETALKMKNDIN